MQTMAPARNDHKTPKYFFILSFQPLSPDFQLTKYCQFSTHLLFLNRRASPEAEPEQSYVKESEDQRAANEFKSKNHHQPRERPAFHRPPHPRRQAALPLQCHPPRPHRSSQRPHRRGAPGPHPPLRQFLRRFKAPRRRRKASRPNYGRQAMADP